MSVQPMPWWAAIDAPDPGNDEGPPGANGKAFKGQSAADGPDSIDRDPKWRAQMAAEFALAGWTLVDCKCGGYVVGRWGRTRHCQDPDSLAAFLAEVTGVRS